MRPEPHPVDLLFDGQEEEPAPEEIPTTTQPAVGSVAEQFASSVGPGTASGLLSPGFDIPDTFSASPKSKTPSSIQDLPTVFEAPDLPQPGDAPESAGDSRQLPRTAPNSPAPPLPQDEVVTFESIGLPTADNLPRPAPTAPPPPIIPIAIPDSIDQLLQARDETVAVPPGTPHPPPPAPDPMGSSITLDDIMSTQRQDRKSVVEGKSVDDGGGRII